MMKNKNGKGLRRLKGIFNVKQPGETVSVDDGKPHVGEKLKVMQKVKVITRHTRNWIVNTCTILLQLIILFIVINIIHIHRK